MTPSWGSSWGTSWANSWGQAGATQDQAQAEPSDISVIFAHDHSALHLLPNEIAQRRRLWLKRQRDKAIEEKEKRRRRELELISLYALVKEAA
jgi:hypothetical protein